MVNEMMALWAPLHSDYFHFTGWIDRLTGLSGRLERIFKDMDAFYQQVIDGHLRPQLPN